jgi:hypothetical protein
MSDGSIACRQPDAYFRRVIVERAHAAAIRDAAGFIDNVEAFRPGGVGSLGGVIEVVDAERDGVVEALDEIVGDGHTLGKIFRLGVAHVVLHIGFHLPFVGWMRFADIDRKEIGVVFIIVVNLHHVTDVAAEGRSSVAAEDNDERSASGPFADVKVISTIQSQQPGVGSVIADLQVSAMHVRQGIAHHSVGVLGTAGHFAESEKRSQQNDHEDRDSPFPELSHC